MGKKARRNGRTSSQLRRQAIRILQSQKALYRGSLIQYSRRCGNPNCKCKRGEPHTGWALSFSDAGRTKVVYLSDELRAEVADGLSEHQQLQGYIEGIIKADVEALRQRARRYKRRQ